MQVWKGIITQKLHEIYPKMWPLSGAIHSIQFEIDIGKSFIQVNLGLEYDTFKENDKVFLRETRPGFISMYKIIPGNKK